MMPVICVNDIQMYYDDLGAGTPLVLLNGATTTNDTDWAQLRPRLAESYRVLQVEHRGHGRSNNPSGRLGFDLFASDITAFIELLEIAPVHLAGFSDGGITALRVAIERPELVRSLVLIGVNYCIDDQVRTAIAALDADALERDEPEYAELLAAIHDPHHGPGYWRTLVRHNAENLIENPSYDEDDLRKVSAPTLIVAGEADLGGNINQVLGMRRSIPKSEMLIVNHAGASWDLSHFVHESRPEVVGPVLLEFLERQSR